MKIRKVMILSSINSIAASISHLYRHKDVMINVNVMVGLFMGEAEDSVQVQLCL